jgi:integrase/recombinase XerC
MLLTDSFLDYLLHERNYSKGTVEYYRADILELQRFGEEMLGDLTPSDVDAELVREWIASLMDKGLASNTINRKLSSIRTYYKFLFTLGSGMSLIIHFFKLFKSSMRINFRCRQTLVSEEFFYRA